jgi:hypothetical protein
LQILLSFPEQSHSIKSVDIFWLKFQYFEIVKLFFLMFIDFLIAKGSIVVSLKVIWIETDSLSIVIDSTVIVLDFSIGESSVNIEI